MVGMILEIAGMNQSKRAALIPERAGMHQGRANMVY